MEHEQGFNDWWSLHEDQYLRYNITRTEFAEYSMRGGFNKRDIIILVGTKPANVQRGDIIVYWGGKQYPIIHRVVAINFENGTRFFQTKGDHNPWQILPDPSRCGEYAQTYGMACLQKTPPYLMDCCLNEGHVQEDVLVGRALVRVPYLGWVKIGFVKLLNMVGIAAS